MAFFSGTTTNDFFDLGQRPDLNFGNDDDAINGLAGDDVINTLVGDDLLVGEDGNDLLLAGLGNDIVKGGNGNDTMEDGPGRDWVFAGGGDDYLFADTGNDVYRGGAGLDTLSFALLNTPGLGVNPQNTVGVTVDLRIVGPQNFGVYGRDDVSGFENVTGGLGNDKLTGTRGANVLTGQDGRDQLQGLGGADTLKGGLNADKLFTGGRDGARDVVLYETAADSTLGQRDSIIGFDKGRGARDDRIDLSIIDADPLTDGDQAFAFRGQKAFTAAPGEVRVTTAGGNTIVHVDTDADFGSEMSIVVRGVSGLHAFDFIL